MQQQELHLKPKLFQSVISRVYSRFLGSNRNSCYTVPGKAKHELMCRNIKSDGNSLYRVLSRTKQGKYPTVDMSTGMCQCFIGCDGPPCAHQLVLWSENIADSVNFIPFTSKDERQRFTRIALGTALPLTFYEPFHSSTRTEVNVVDLFSETDDIPSQVKHLTFIYVRYCNWKQHGSKLLLQQLIITK